MERELQYHNIMLEALYGVLDSRSEADTTVTIKALNHKFKLPVIPSNMETVINYDIAKKLDNNGYMYVMHRFDNFATSEKILKDDEIKIKSISIGVNEDSKQFIDKWKDHIDILTIDVAHGYSKKVTGMVKYITQHTPIRCIVAGNINTLDGYIHLSNLGVNYVKVGIGSGAICTTYNKTGFGTPMVSLLRRIRDYRRYNHNTAGVIADGGCKDYGDIAKAIACGADMVMSGYFFASCSDSPAKTVDGKKIYYGSTSINQKKDWFNYVEGRQVEITIDGLDVLSKMIEIQKALESSISYSGGKTLVSLLDTPYYVV